MPMDSVCRENVERLMGEHAARKDELEKTKNTDIETIWLNELTELKAEYEKMMDDYNSKNDSKDSNDSNSNSNKKHSSSNKKKLASKTSKTINSKK